MMDLSVSIYDLELYLLVLMRVSGFVFIAPFFSTTGTPARVRVLLSVFIAYFIYGTITPAPAVEYNSVVGYALIVVRETMTGILFGFGANICSSIVTFAGSVADMETGLSMVTLMDPATKQQSSFTGVLYQYAIYMMMIVTGLYRYLIGALADTFTLIPVNGAIFHGDSLLESMIVFLKDYIMIGFQIVLPLFCVILILNAVLGVLAKVSPQLNMFAVGMQMKIIVGLSVLFVMAGMISTAAEFIFDEMKEMMVAFTGGMM